MKLGGQIHYQSGFYCFSLRNNFSLPVGASYNLDDSRARACCACSCCGGVVWAFLFSSILNNYESCGDNTVLDCSQPPEEDLQPILREEVEIAVASLKKGKSAGVDNIPAELVQAGGETMIDILTEICNRIWRTGDWLTP